jgi:hypothetical protein
MAAAMWLYFWILCSIASCVYFCASTMMLSLVQFYSKFEVGGIVIPPVLNYGHNQLEYKIT